MRLKHQWWSGLMAAVLGGLVSVTAVVAGEQFIPVLGVREGAARSTVIPITNGFIDYLTLLNERDGGHQRRDTGLGRVRNRPRRHPRCRVLRAPENQGPRGGGVSAEQHHSRQCPDGAGHARPDPAARRSAWGARTPRMGGCFRTSSTPDHLLEPEHGQDPFLGLRVGGKAAQLKGLKIVHVYVDNAAGRETMPILDLQAARYGFTVQHLALRCRASTRRRPGCG